MFPRDQLFCDKGKFRYKELSLVGQIVVNCFFKLLRKLWIKANIRWDSIDSIFYTTNMHKYMCCHKIACLFKNSYWGPIAVRSPLYFTTDFTLWGLSMGVDIHSGVFFYFQCRDLWANRSYFPRNAVICKQFFQKNNRQLASTKICSFWGLGISCKEFDFAS